MLRVAVDLVIKGKGGGHSPYPSMRSTAQAAGESYIWQPALLSKRLFAGCFDSCLAIAWGGGEAQVVPSVRYLRREVDIYLSS